MVVGWRTCTLIADISCAAWFGSACRCVAGTDRAGCVCEPGDVSHSAPTTPALSLPPASLHQHSLLRLPPPRCPFHVGLFTAGAAAAVAPRWRTNAAVHKGLNINVAAAAGAGLLCFGRDRVASSTGAVRLCHR